LRIYILKVLINKGVLSIHQYINKKERREEVGRQTKANRKDIVEGIKWD
jgi:hypothetical protein